MLTRRLLLGAAAMVPLAARADDTFPFHFGSARSIQLRGYPAGCSFCVFTANTMITPVYGSQLP